MHIYSPYNLQISLSDAKKQTTRLVGDIANSDNDDGDSNDMICRYIVYIIYRSSCLSRTTRLFGDIAIFQQYVLVI